MPRLDPFIALLAEGAPSRGIYLRGPAEEDAIKQLVQDAKVELGDDIPEGYLRLLRISNGIQIDNVILDGTHDFVANNVNDRRYPEYETLLIFGSNGNAARYLFDKRSGLFNVVSFFFPNEVDESFESFDELLLEILRSQRAL